MRSQREGLPLSVSTAVAVCSDLFAGVKKLLRASPQNVRIYIKVKVFLMVLPLFGRVWIELGFARPKHHRFRHLRVRVSWLWRRLTCGLGLSSVRGLIRVESVELGRGRCSN